MSNSIKTKSLKDKMKAAKLPQRHVAVCFRGDLHAEIQRLDAELRAVNANANGDSRLTGNTEAQRIKAQIEAGQAEMRDYTEDFIFRALPARGTPERPTWNELRAKHPQRKDEPRDEAHNVNIDTFSDALIRICVVQPEMDDETWDELLPTLSDRQYDEIVSAAFAANLDRVSVPFSPAVSVMMQTSASESKRPNESGSASDDSTAGNPAA